MTHPDTSHSRLRSRSFKALKLALIPLSVFTLTSTQLGVFLIFDLLGDLKGTDNFQTTHQDAPFELSHVLDSPEIILLPKEIKQVSGLVAHPTRFALLTDQAEFINLPRDPHFEAESESIFPRTPLLFKQGSLEAITQIDNEYWLAGDRPNFLRIDQEGEVIAKRPLPQGMESSEITGLAWGDGTLFATSSDTMQVHAIQLNTDKVQQIDLDFQSFTQTPINPDALMWSGVAYDAGLLYLIAENIPVIVVANPQTGQVMQTIGIAEGSEFSDIAVRDGVIALPQDHNLFDPRPPLRLYPSPS